MTGQAVSGVYGHTGKPASGARTTQVGGLQTKVRQEVSLSAVGLYAALMGLGKAELLRTWFSTAA